MCNLQWMSFVLARQWSECSKFGNEGLLAGSVFDIVALRARWARGTTRLVAEEVGPEGMVSAVVVVIKAQT